MHGTVQQKAKEQNPALKLLIVEHMKQTSKLTLSIYALFAVTCKIMCKCCANHRPGELFDHTGGTCHSCSGHQQSHPRRGHGKLKSKEDLASAEGQGKSRQGAKYSSQHAVLLKCTCCVFPLLFICCMTGSHIF